MITLPMYIDGQDVEGKGWTYVIRASEMIRNPIEKLTLKRQLEIGNISVEDLCDEDRNAVIGRCAWSDRDDNRRAIQSAYEASKEFSKFPLNVRKELASIVYRKIKENAERLIELLVVEGHPVKLARWEVDGILKGGDPRTIELIFSQMQYSFNHDDTELTILRKADGVVCINPPQNAAGSNGAMGTYALYSGNALVVKAPRSVPLSVMFYYREIIAPALEEIGAPKGTLNIISGKSKEIIKEWVSNPLVNNVIFFGDSNVGLKIQKDCITNGKKHVLELSGNDGFLIWKDANLEDAAKALIECFYGSSQICMVPKFAIAHPDIAQEFLEIFIPEVNKIRPDFAENKDTILSPVLKTDGFFELLNDAVSQNIDVLTGGNKVDIHGDISHEGLFVQPTVLQVDGLNMAGNLKCVREETFFPLLPIVIPEKKNDTEQLNEIITFLNSNPYGLRNSLWAKDQTVIDEFVQSVKSSGILKVNESHISFNPYIATHGGPGLTGGPFGELNYVTLRTSRLQGICVNQNGGYASPL